VLDFGRLRCGSNACGLIRWAMKSLEEMIRPDAQRRVEDFVKHEAGRAAENRPNDGQEY